MLLCAFVFLSFFGNDARASHATAPKTGQLNGTWIPTEQEFAGNKMAALSFEKQFLVISDSTYSLTAESADKGTISYSKGKMDIRGKEGPNKGKHFMAIYKLKKDVLTICYNLAGDGYPEKFETEGHAMYFMSTFKRRQ